MLDSRVAGDRDEAQFPAGVWLEPRVRARGATAAGVGCRLKGYGVHSTIKYGQGRDSWQVDRCCWTGAGYMFYYSREQDENNGGVSSPSAFPVESVSITIWWKSTRRASSGRASGRVENLPRGSPGEPQRRRTSGERRAEEETDEGKQQRRRGGSGTPCDPPLQAQSLHGNERVNN